MFDSHCHLDAERYSGEWAEILDRAQAQGVTKVMAPALHLDSARTLQNYAKDDPRIATAVGIHPHEADRFNPQSADEMGELLGNAQAIGETGLEYHYDFVEADQQMRSLRAHLDLAEQSQKPIILHCREAEQDLYQELSKRELKGGGVVHCFTGGWEWAQKFLDLGFHLGITGMVTFKNATQVGEVARNCPLDRLLVETDGPYLAPIPHRGKTNYPSYIPLIVRRVAELRDSDFEEIALATHRNTELLFGF